MQIEFRESGLNLVAAIRGEIDHHTAEEIKKRIEGEFSLSGYKNLILDFTDVNFMDSSGIGMVIGRYKTICNVGGKVGVVNVSPQLERIFDISGLQKIIEVFDTTESALKKMGEA